MFCTVSNSLWRSCLRCPISGIELYSLLIVNDPPCPSKPDRQCAQPPCIKHWDAPPLQSFDELPVGTIGHWKLRICDNDQPGFNRVQQSVAKRFTSAGDAAYHNIRPQPGISFQ